MRRTALLLATTLLAPVGAGAFAPIGPIWEDGKADVAIGRLSYWWASNIRAAADEWSDATSFEFEVVSRDRGPCSEDNLELRNGVDFAEEMCGREEFGEGVLAVMQWFDDGEGLFLSAGITFNDAYSWAVYGGPWREDKADFRRVALHELGHYLGLDHENSAPSIMAAFVGEIDDLQQDDIDGAESLYGSFVPPPEEPMLEPEVQCRVDQLKAAGRLCKKHLKCQAAFVKDPAADPGGVARDACVAAAQADFASRWDGAIAATQDAGEACANEDPGATVEPGVSMAAAQLETDIGSGNPADPLDRRLRARLMKKAATFCGADFAAWRAEAIESDAAALADALASAANAFVAGADKAIASAAADGVVYDGAAPATLVPVVEALANGLGAATGP